jgi:hypothetical protein
MNKQKARELKKEVTINLTDVDIKEALSIYLNIHKDSITFIYLAGFSGRHQLRYLI